VTAAGTVVRRLLAVVLALVALTLGGAGAASAHTTIDLVDPTDGSRLTSAPEQLQVRFGESLPLRDTSVRLALSSGRTLAEGPLTSDSTEPASDEGTFTLPEDLATGSYIVTVTARGSDGHTLSEAFAFTVGDAPLVRAEGATSPTDSPGLIALAGLAGFVTAAGLAALGFGYVASWCWPEVLRRPLARRIAAAGAGLVALGSLADLAALCWAQGVGPVGVLGSQAGRLLLLRVVGLVLVVLAGRAFTRVATTTGTARGTRQNLLLMAAVPLLLGVVGSSHAAGDAWSLVTLLAGCVHAASMALWLGGLAWLWLSSRDDTTPTIAAARFSRTATACAATAVATGVFLAYRLTQGGSWSVLASGYGVLLAVKVALVAGLLLLARRTHGALLAVDRAESAGDGTGAPPPGTGSGPGPMAVLAPATAARLRLTAALRAESVAGIAVLAAAGLLTSIGPGA
jgi:copper transport protein